jgi:hypothetical protein
MQPVRVPPAAPVALPRDSGDPARDDYSRPGPGRVPLLVESTGRPQHVGITLAIEQQGTGFESTLIMRHRDFCVTPCALYVHPGVFALHATAPGVVETTSRVRVPPWGTRANLFAPSSTLQGAATFFAGGALLGGLAGLGMLGLADAFASNELLYTGFITLGVSAVLLIPGIVLFVTNRRGVRALSPLDYTASGP